MTHVRLLGASERIYELAQMLGGTGDKAMDSAEEILAYVEQIKAASGAEPHD